MLVKYQPGYVPRSTLTGRRLPYEKGSESPEVSYKRHKRVIEVHKSGDRILIRQCELWILSNNFSAKPIYLSEKEADALRKKLLELLQAQKDEIIQFGYLLFTVFVILGIYYACSNL